MTQACVYTRDQLIAICRSTTGCTLDCDVTTRVRSLFNVRGCRAGWQVRRKQLRRTMCVASAADTDRIPTIVGNRLSPCSFRHSALRPHTPHSQPLSYVYGATDVAIDTTYDGTIDDRVIRATHDGATDDGATNDDVTDGATGDAVGVTSPSGTAQQPSNLIRAHIQRHSSPTTNRLVFGSMNVQSANRKIDDILAMKRDQSLDVLCLCETWHDDDSVSIRRLRAEGLQVLECARP